MTGRAFDRAEGGGIADVQIAVADERTRSDAQGYIDFTVDLAEDGPAAVRASAPAGWIPVASGADGLLATELRVENDRARLFVEMERAPILEGVVLLAGDAPAAGARVEVSAVRRVETSEGICPLSASHAIEAGQDGRFSVSLYPRARNGIVASLGDALAAETIGATSDHGRRETVLHLREAAYAAGRVETPWGEPAGDVDLAFISTDANGSAQTTETRSIADGTFVAGPLLAGSIEVTADVPASAPYFAPEPMSLSLADGERRSDIVVKLAPGDFIDGIVLDEDGHPVEGASVAAKFGIVRAPSSPPERIATDAAGRFRIMGVPPGKALPSFVVAHPGSISETRRHVAMLDGEQRIVLRRASEATLRATWAEDGSPVTYYAWRLLRIGTDGDDRDTGRLMEEVDSPDGTTTLEMLAPGNYRAEVAVLGPDGAPSDLRESSAFEVKTPGEAVAVEVAVRGGAFVEGVVVRSPEGTPVADATVEFLPPRRDKEAEASPDLFRISATKTDASGHFEFAGVPAGRYALVAHAGELRMTEPAAELVVGTDSPPVVRMQLATGAVVKGTVRGRDGMPLAGVRMFHAERDAGGDGFTERETLTGRDGFYSFTGLSSGAHAIRAWQRRLDVNDRREIDLVVGEERVLDFDLSGLVTLTGRVTVDGSSPGTRAPAVYLAASDGTRSPLFDIAPDGAYRVETPPGVFNIVLRSDGTSGEGEQVLVPASPAMQTRDFDIATTSAEIMAFFPDGKAFAPGTVTIAPRTMAARTPTIRLRMEGERRHVPSLMAGEYLATFASDDGAWRGDSDWMTMAPGGDAAFAIEVRETAEDSVVGVWQREDVTLAWRTWSWDVSRAVDRAGLHEVSIRHLRGRDGIEAERATLFVNGRAVAEDAHHAWTGSEAHLGNSFRLRVPDRPAGAVVTIELRIKGSGGTDSAGEARVGRR